MSRHYEPWTADEEAHLMRLFEKQATNAELARLLGKTIGQIAGKIHRLGLSGERSDLQPPNFKNAVRKPRTDKRNRKPPAGPKKPGRKPQRQQRMARPSDAIWHPATCQYPVGDPQDENFHFCGVAIKADGRPYCDTHHELCTLPWSQHNHYGGKKDG